MDKKIYTAYIQCPRCLKRLVMKSENSFNATPYCKECDTEYLVHIKHVDNEEIKITIKEK